MITFPAGHYALDSIAGVVATITKNLELPKLLYVYGINNDYPHDIYIDNNIPRAKHLAVFLRKNTNLAVINGLPTENRGEWPGVALSKRIREESHLASVSQILVFLLLVVNGRVNCQYEAIFENPSWREGDYAKAKDGVKIFKVMEVRERTNAKTSIIVDNNGHSYHSVDLDFVRPSSVGNYVRTISGEHYEGEIVTINDNFKEVVVNSVREGYVTLLMDQLMRTTK